MSQELTRSKIKDEPVLIQEEVEHIQQVTETLEVTEHVSVKNEPETNEELVKINPIFIGELPPSQEIVKEQPCPPAVLQQIEIVCVKEEPRWDGPDWEVSETAQAALYTGHEGKPDLVIGTESLQPWDAAFTMVPPYEVDISYKQHAGRGSGKAGRGTRGDAARTRLGARTGRRPGDGTKINRDNRLVHKRKAATTRKQYKNKHKLPSNLDPADDKFICDVCSKTFTIKTLLIRHIVYFHTKTNRYYCDICNKESSSHKFAYTHREQHTEKRYTCKICQKRFARASYLSRHERIHEGEKPWRCEVCQKQFRERSQLYIHAMIHEGEKAKRYPCPDCPMKFSQRYKLARHQRVHAQILPYACNVCNKKFTQNFLLGVHLRRVHTGEKPFSCEICQKMFVSNIDLVRHRRIHTGAKPYPCDICGKQFSQKAHLKAHILIHTGEKPYYCDVCQKPFSARRTLNRHKQTHTKESSYSCTICDKQFKQEGRWKKHQESHSLESEQKL